MRVLFRGLTRLIPALVAGSVLGAAAAVPAEKTDFTSIVRASSPIAFYALGSPHAEGSAGPNQYRAKGGVQMVAEGGPIPASPGYTALNGSDGWILTGQAGGVNGDASMMAWVKLDALPSASQHFFYVMGESQYGNDLDVQFETDNSLRFYTAAGGNIRFQPDPDTLIGVWHMIVVTFDASRSRAIYWDGRPVAHDTGGGEPDKKGFLSIGASTVFSGRFFDGGIADVALWSRALSAAEIAKLYAASGAGRPGSR